MAAVYYKRFNALLYPNQAYFLEKEAERRGVSANAVLRAQLDFAIATLGARAKLGLGEWNPDEGRAQKALAVHGLVLRRAEKHGRYIILCGHRVIKTNNRRASTLDEVAEFVSSLDKQRAANHGSLKKEATSCSLGH